MILVQQIKRRIVLELRHEPLNHYVLAAELREPPFRVRAELKALKRDRLVRDIYTSNGQHVWQLTERGERAAYETDQLELA
mgnify:CR=1 FL=1